ncbi:F510_1955 family glycosylhydrolase [Microbacterium phosphatis]|uniref:F510_1955 family glycosylhydrolase n=1 Tax=Microbacterium phosphatis TaxID=3140248 RepID=UPI0031400801
MPFTTAVPRRRLAAFAALALTVPLLAGCALIRSEDPDHDTQVALEHIHGLASDPETGGLLIASHGGIYRLDALTPSAELTGPVAGNDFDGMGFTAVAGSLYASGHPGPNSPEHFGAQNLGLIRSDDNARTWTNIAFTGEADFHDLALSESDPSRIYANNYGIVYRSDDGGRTWNDGVGVDARDILADPNDSDTVYATAPEGVYVSHDGAETFELDEGAPRMMLIAANSLGLLVGTSFDGTLVYQLPSGEWTTGGEYTGGVQALTITPGDEIVIADQRGISLTSDFGVTWEPLFRPEPHV